MFCWPRITEKQGEVRPAPSNVVFKNSEVNYALPGVAYRLNGALGHFWEDVRPSYAFAGALDYNNLSWLNKKDSEVQGNAGRRFPRLEGHPHLGRRVRVHKIHSVIMQDLASNTLPQIRFAWLIHPQGRDH